jgi:CO/xanthine dehydrogenase Mo-binding subunit
VAGVVYVITGKEVKENMQLIVEAYDTAAMGAKSVKWYALCPERVRFVGEAVAAVVAEDKYTARQAADLIQVDYEELPVVFDPEEAMKPGAPLVEPDWGDNIMVTRDFRTGDVDKAFAEADGTISGVVKTQRYTTMPTAVDVPSVEVEHMETVSPFNPLGCKGVGESGVTGPLGALCSAVENALPHLKLNLAEMPLTPNRVWQAIHRAEQR